MALSGHVSDAFVIADGKGKGRGAPSPTPQGTPVKMKPTPPMSNQSAKPIEASTPKASLPPKKITTDDLRKEPREVEQGREKAGRAAAAPAKKPIANEPNPVAPKLEKSKAPNQGNACWIGRFAQDG